MTSLPTNKNMQYPYLYQCFRKRLYWEASKTVFVIIKTYDLNQGGITWQLFYAGLLQNNQELKSLKQSHL